MNIFKVFASSKKSFPEECMSALILWLLNPQMEHGLGYEFLQRFIEKLGKRDPKLTSLEKRLVSQLRKSSQDEEDDQCECEDVLCDLETHVTSDTGEAFIDAVLEFSDTILAIENKIYTNSASDFTQLCREYDGLRNAVTGEKIKTKRRIVLIFLVPGDVDVASMDEWQHKPDVQDGDSIQIVTWKENNQGYPSVYTLISELLRDEADGRTEPIPEYTRHTLKALNAFICNDFQGYYYKKPTSIGGLNPLAEGTENIQLLLGKTEGYVGVRFGINGLLRMSSVSLKNAKFQYTTKSEIEGSRDWLPLDVFKNIVYWLQGKSVTHLQFSAKIDGKTLKKLVGTCDNRYIHIGVQGGLKTIAQSNQDILTRYYKIEVTTEAVNKNSQWFSGAEFLEVLKRKNI